MKVFIIGLLKGIAVAVMGVFLLIGIFSIAIVYFKPQLATDLLQKFLIPVPEIEQIELKGIGIIGDSQSDEYRADDNRGSNYPTSTYNWVELLASQRDVNFGEWSYHEEPRRQGFEYNFSRSGATASTMIDQGQHTKLVPYIENGEVNAVIIYIGANDFAPYLYDNAYSALYNNELSRSQILQKENQIVANIETAVETLKETGDVKIFILTIPDWGNHTAVKIGFPFPHQRYRVTKVLNETNIKIEALAKKYNATLVNSNDFYRSLRTSDSYYQVKIGDTLLEQFLTQNNPKNVFLGDGVHLGTAVNGLFANFILEKINPHLVEPIELMSEKEIISVSNIN